MRTLTRIVLATSAVAVLHSALASRPAKSAAARLVGERNRNAFYRPFFHAQSVVTFGGLLLYIGRQPNREIWRVGTIPTIAFNAIRIAALGAMISAVRQIGLRRLLGVTGVKAWSSGVQEVPAEPEAQGPALDQARPVSGPFRYTRHPLNFLGLPLLWLAPRMTRNRLVFNLVASFYLYLGSWHEEHRLRLAYGEKYEEYRKQAYFLLGHKKLIQSPPPATTSD